MSRIKSDKINFGSSIVVNFPVEKETVEQSNEETDFPRIPSLTQQALDEANNEARSIISAANLRAQEITKNAQDALEEANLEAQKILEQAKQKALEIEQSAQEEIEALKLSASQEGAKEGYEAGYTDGKANIEQEMKQKIQDLDDAAQSAYELRQKILTASKREIVELVLLIAKKICINSIDADSIAKVVNNSIALLSDKDNIEIILSEKYANLFNEILNGENTQDIDIDKLRNIKLTYNSKINDDTIIVQTPKERLDLGFSSQIDEIARSFISCLDTGEE